MITDLDRGVATAFRARWFGLALVLGLPAFVLVSVPNLLNQASMLDPYVYTGYIHSYHELLARFGRTYYSTRIAFIHPARALAALFGDYGGYVALRYVALALALGSVWSIARRYYGARVAAFSVVFAALQPLFVRSLLWDYVDGFATTYLLAGAACLIGLSRDPGPALWFAAGVCLALATNAHPFTLAVGGLFLPAWLVLQPVHWSGRRRVAAVGTVAAGLVVTTVLLGMILRLELRTGAQFYDSTSLSVGLQLLSGSAKTWFAPWSAIPAALRFLALTPLFLGAIVAVIVVRNRQLAHPRLCIAGLVYTAGVYVFYLVMHVVFQGAVFVTFQVLTYLFPAMVISVICAVGESASRTGERTNRFLWWAAGAYTLLWIAWGSLDPLMSRVPLWATGIVASASLTVLAAVSEPAASLVVVLVASILSATTFYRSKQYGQMHNRATHTVEAVTYRAALHLMQVVGSLPDGNRPVVFWYPDREHLPDLYLSLNSVQSTYLWGYTRLSHPQTGEAALDAVSMERLRRASRIVLMGYQEREIEEYRRFLDEAGIVTRAIDDDRFDESGFSYRTVVLDRLPPPSGIVTTLSPRSFQPSNGGALVDTGASMILTTPPLQWAYAAFAPIPPPSRPRSAATMRLRVRVIEGELGIGVTTAGDVSRFLSETSVKPTDAPHDVSIDVSSAGTGMIILRSQAPADVTTRAELFAMDLGEVPAAPRPEIRIVAVPLDSIQPQNGGVVARANGALSLTTPPQQWAYAALARVPVPKEATGAAVVRVRVQVDAGELGVAATPASDVSRFITERSAVATGAPVDVSLAVPDIRQFGYVVFRSWTSNGTRTRARILGIDVIQPGS